ncbi:MAG TPA: hypothetical protein VKA91_09370 [Nitrososphaeraceae archaeon]|nr:hypothetical protein [Nitrososphaeraceae archaeon]
MIESSEAMIGEQNNWVVGERIAFPIQNKAHNNKNAFFRCYGVD